MALTLSIEKLIDILNKTKEGPPEFRYRNHAVIVMSNCLGLRAKELAEIKICSIFNCEQVKIRSKLKIDREITIPDDIKKSLSFYCDCRCDEEIKGYFSSDDEKNLNRCMDSPLFKSKKGGSFSANTMQKLIKRIYVESGYPEFSSHSGRDAYIRNLIAAGDDVEAVMKKAGLSSKQTTLRYFKDTFAD